MWSTRPATRATSPASRSRPGSCRSASRGPWSSSVAGLGLAARRCRPGPRPSPWPGVVLAIGYGYDLAFKGTAWSWLPFAVGIPLLPVFGWLGATGGLPASFAVLLPVAVAGRRGPGHRQRPGRPGARRRGRRRTRWRSGWGRNAPGRSRRRCWSWSSGRPSSASSWSAARRPRSSPPPGRSSSSPLGVALGRSHDADRLELAWRLLAIGVAILAAAWLGGVTLGA